MESGPDMRGKGLAKQAAIAIALVAHQIQGLAPQRAANEVEVALACRMSTPALTNSITGRDANNEGHVALSDRPVGPKTRLCDDGMSSIIWIKSATPPR